MCELEYTLLIICRFPAGVELLVEIILKGYDFTINEDNKYHYYYNINITNVSPISGLESKETEVHIIKDHSQK